MPVTRRLLLRGLGASVLIAGAGAGGAGAAAHAALWQMLRERDAVAMLRHALAPGTGDPASFELGDCSTQRNLSADGRAQARVIGERFRANGILRAEVRSSQWCRCLETARLLDLGPVVPLPALNSFFRERAQGAGQTRALLDHLREWRRSLPLVLVTHQVNITSLTDAFPASGEIVVLRPGDEPAAVEVLGRIRAEGS
jgi:phosphohistidine phosphatase SixA